MDEVQTYISELIAMGFTQQSIANKVTLFSNVKVTQADIYRFKEGVYKRPTFEKTNAVRCFYFSLKNKKALVEQD